ncbi:MAG: hypothetical protein K8U57_01345 [Planctomycetes bacterium]|nr:hypothetical protein [Planctomycetota bacterium]
MPFHIAIDSNQRLATVTSTSRGDAVGVRNALLELVARPEFEAGYSVLIDARAFDFTPTAAEIRGFVDFHFSYESLCRSRVAIVVARLQDFGMANMFATLCNLNDAPVRSFMSIDEARRWLAAISRHADHDN